MADNHRRSDGYLFFISTDRQWKQKIFIVDGLSKFSYKIVDETTKLKIKNEAKNYSELRKDKFFDIRITKPVVDEWLETISSVFLTCLQCRSLNQLMMPIISKVN